MNTEMVAKKITSKLSLRKQETRYLGINIKEKTICVMKLG